MRLTALLLLLPLLAATATASTAPGVEVTFRAPAEFDGTTDADVAWVALVLSPHDAARATALLGAGAVLVNHTTLHTVIQDPLTGSRVADERALPPERHALRGDTTLEVHGADEWTAVLLAGDLHLTLDGAGRLAWGDEGSSWARVAGPRDHPATVARPDARVLPLTGAYLAAAGTVHVAGVLDAMEWHGLDATCHGDEAPCAGPAAQPAAPGASTRTYHRVEGDGTVTWNGTAHRVLAGRGGLDALLDGTLRLPLAQSDGDCPGCTAWDDQTLALDGTVGLHGVRSTGEDRLQATLSGDVRAAYLDERPEAAGRLGLGVAAGAAVVGGLGALALLALRVALTPERALRNPSRRTIHEAIAQQPGISFRNVQRCTGLGNGNTVYHLSVLEASGLVRSRRHHNQVHYFLPRHFDGDAWRAEVTLAREELRRLHGLVTALNTPTQGELVTVTGRWGWSRAVTQKRLRKLEEAALVRVIASGRFRHYVAVPHEGLTAGAHTPVPTPASVAAPA